MMKRLWPFLLLNVAVSAATVIIVLLIWNAAHSPNQTPSLVGMSSISTPSHSTQATLPALGENLFKIQTVFGTGDLENEYVHILYLGSDPLNLANWQIRDEHDHHFTFPAFIIYKNGAFDLYTKAGTNSTIELYMAQTSSLWKSAETITLLDPAGNTRLTFQIP
jgi:hypothetical protein